MGRNTTYHLVEHIWRLIRALFILTGTALWLYSDVSPHIIFICFIGAALTDQLHGKICAIIESVLRLPKQHSDWE